MCELFGISSNIPVTANFSLETFARHSGLEGPNRDGWGIAYYEGRDIRLFKEAEPASNSEWLDFVEKHQLCSTLIISHIRMATQGKSDFANTHPFIRELGGQMHVFAHNGNLANVRQNPDLVPRRFRPVGTTDSEYAFCALLERLSGPWLDTDSVPPLAQRFDIVTEFAEIIHPLGPANFLYADSDALFVHANKRTQPKSGKIGPPGLYRLSRHCSPERSVGIGGFRMQDCEQQVQLVASVPLSKENWTPLAEGDVLCLRDGAIVAPRHLAEAL
jgi:predicted glutamine amidotransferase